MAALAVTAMGPDRPGIVAAVAGVLRDHGGNVEDSAMTILGGRFSLALLVETGTAPDQLEQALADATDGMGLHLGVAPAGSAADAADATHLLSVYGSDQPGILAEVSSALAAVDANVADLSTRLLDGGDEPVWAMVVELVADDEPALRDAVAAAADGLGCDWTLRPLDAPTY